MARGWLRLAWMLPWVVGTPALAYVLGRLKTVYFYRAFGVDVAALELSLVDYAFESWFVLQNVLFFVLLWWVVLAARRVWTVAVGLVYSLLPIASHYAFLAHDRAPAALLIEYRHTLLKLVPFALVAVVWLAHADVRPALRSLGWSRGRGALALFGVITLAWALSAAKHFGSFDAQRTLLDTERQLSRVQLRGAPRPADGAGELYLLHAGARRLVVFDRSGFTYGASPEVRVLLVPADARLELTKRFEVQPGSLFL